MRTDDLIRSLVADTQPSQLTLERRLLLALAAGVAVAAAGFLIVLGPRPDIASAIMTVRFDLKLLQVTLLLIATVILALRLSRPGTVVGLAWAVFFAAPGLLLLGSAIELSVTPQTNWLVLAIGSNWRICLTAIPLMAVPVLIGTIYALSFGAPTRPVLTGAVAGLVAGSAAAMMYATHCTDDSPLFVTIWYSLAIASVMVFGALLGRLLLRW